MSPWRVFLAACLFCGIVHLSMNQATEDRWWMRKKKKTKQHGVIDTCGKWVIFGHVSVCKLLMIHSEVVVKAPCDGGVQESVHWEVINIQTQTRPKQVQHGENHVCFSFYLFQIKLIETYWSPLRTWMVWWQTEVEDSICIAIILIIFTQPHSTQAISSSLYLFILLYLDKCFYCVYVLCVWFKFVCCFSDATENLNFSEELIPKGSTKWSLSRLLGSSDLRHHEAV